MQIYAVAWPVGGAASQYNVFIGQYIQLVDSYLPEQVAYWDMIEKSENVKASSHMVSKPKQIYEYGQCVFSLSSKNEILNLEVLISVKVAQRSVALSSSPVAVLKFDNIITL